MDGDLSDILDAELDDVDDLQVYGVDPDTLLSQVSQYDRYAVRGRIVDRYMREYSEEQARKLNPQCSLERQLIQAVVDAAWPYAISVNATVWNFDNDIVEQGVGVISGLQSSLVERVSENGSDAELNFWHHDRNPISTFKVGDMPYMDREGIECAASSYLELPYRVPQLERLIVDVLIAAELYGFYDEMLRPMPLKYRWLATMPTQQHHALLGFLVNELFNAVILLGIAYGAANYLPPLIGSSPANWVAGVAVALFALGFVIRTIALPGRWYNQSKASGKVQELLRAMVLTYAELRSGGALSARRVREAASKAADKGVVWPGPLFALLDDNISRTGML